MPCRVSTLQRGSGKGFAGPEDLFIPFIHVIKLRAAISLNLHANMVKPTSIRDYDYDMFTSQGFSLT